MGAAQDFGAMVGYTLRMCFQEGYSAALGRTDELTGAGQGRDYKDIVKLFNCDLFIYSLV